MDAGINKRGESVEDKINKLDVELCKYREQIQKTRSGPVQQALKACAMRLLKQKKMYEGQRDMLYNQTFNLDQVSFAAERLKDAQQTVIYASSSAMSISVCEQFRVLVTIISRDATS
ncbi:vacuolar protein sorting-associated protein 60.1-like [Brassica napus]|uniref:vacuolar protein sorting-associated protein 60.1-like n=1 Tax=Brassica napus TaxID=3708 RepID=UPI000BBE2379|nr:vacuolar protein sorting-associated protein 60.1-like [Brassica napus]